MRESRRPAILAMLDELGGRTVIGRAMPAAVQARTRNRDFSSMPLSRWSTADRGRWWQGGMSGSGTGVRTSAAGRSRGPAVSLP